jgi:hypothetical protein
MAQIITARLARIDSQPWGFRLQGGKDFGTPLVIQKVHTGSIADKAGLQAGDAVVRINQTDLFNLRHKDAQDAIVQAGPSFELVVQRGGATWKPTVTPMSSAAASPIPGNFTPVTKTSLAANKQPVSAIGTGHNTAARPFVPPSPVRSIVNKQYNSPVAMYSEETIAETLTSQAEVLAGGCLGVNFKKNEKVYNPEKSEVLKALQENDSEPEPVGSSFYSKQSHAIGGSALTYQCTRPLTPSYQNIPDSRMGTSLQQNVLAPPATHRPSLPVHSVQPVQKTAPQPEHKQPEIVNVVPSALPAPPQISIEKNLGASTISSALNAHAGNLNGNVPSNISGPKPFSYTQAPIQVTNVAVNPPMAAPKSPSSYPPPNQPTWAPQSAAPVAPKPAGPVQGGLNKKLGFKPKGSVGTPGALAKHGRTFTTSGPNRGQGILTQPATGRIPICGVCASQIRGPFVTALGRTWCPAHFLCVNQNCRRELMDIGFVEEKGDLYCEYCFEQFLAPPCSKCNGKIKGDCLNAIGRKFHPECFKCTYCSKLFGNNPFFLEEGEPYCEADWNELFTTKCFACGFPVEAGDRWVEALNNNYHSQCFNCTYCKKNLEGQSFFAKGGRPFCKNHAR